jgi:protein-L-isoaspartate O-methyltransferase
MEVYVCDPGYRDGTTPSVRVRRNLRGADWAEAGPFDAVIYHYTVGEISSEILDLLAEGGTCIAPMASPSGMQLLIAVISRNGSVQVKSVGECFFSTE